jgi:5-methylcytosine-specific restriction endonuclease McrA
MDPRFPPAAEGRDRRRDASQAWRAWSKSAEWQALRDAVLLRDELTCRLCGWQHPKREELLLLKSVGAEPAFRMPRDGRLVGDHRQPHRGDRGLFFDPTNVQCLCKRCHDGTKQRIDRART